MAIRDEIGEQASTNTDESAVQPGKGPQRAPRNAKLLGKRSANPHNEHQDKHGSGEGLTGMQSGAGHPHGR
jgi:hypothetical protein